MLIQSNLNLSENTIDIVKLDKGLYLYRISVNGTLLKAGKIVKQ
ncbi:MAG: T9SS type A sorting domain-containing protein [Paludibacter sp.]|nr:T9SS type A sorting domain-containing protein [Paludibacter sp.]